MTETSRQATGRRTPWIAAGAVSSGLLLALGVQAQEQGPLATIGLSFGGQYTNNDPGADESRFTTGLRFDLRNSTRGQSFRLSADGRLLVDDQGSGFDNPGLSFAYTRSNQSTELSFSGSYRERDVDGDVLVVDPLDLTAADLIEDDGTRENLQLNAGLVTGRDARFGTDTRFGYTSRRFTGTADPDLTDLETWQVSTALRFDINPNVTLRTTASYVETDEDDAEQTLRRTGRVGVGADLTLDPLWSASVNLRYSRIETERDDGLGGRTLTEQEGGEVTLSLNRQLRTGSLGLSFAREITANGPEDTLRLSRDTRLPNGGELAWSLGMVSFPTGETEPLASLSYTMPTPTGSFGVNLTQTASIDGEDRSVLRTTLGIDYDQEINTTSSWSLNGSLAGIDVVGSDIDDRLTAEVGVGYNHALTQDWDLSTRLRHRVTYEDGAEDTRANILSFSLQRSFSFRP